MSCLEKALALVEQRIEIPAHYDLWMRGARYGRVMRMGKGGEFVYVKLDHPQVRRQLKLPCIDFDYIKII